MKISTCILLIICFTAFTLMASVTSGQNISQIKITISEKNTTLSKVLANIERQAAIHFVYESKLLQNQKVITYNVREATLQSVLKDLLTLRGLSFRQTGDNILIEQNVENQIGAQEKTAVVKPKATIMAKGVTLDENGAILPGVTITVRETSKSVASKNDGTFAIEAEVGQTLIFSFVGYQKVERTVSDNALIRVSMVLENNALSDVVVIGYGTQKRGDVTTAISSLKAQDINDFPSAGVDKAMTGKLAGVQILEPSGAPGAGISIAIRGKATITAGSQPLYVIDGIPLSEKNSTGPGLTVNPLNNINPADIETVDVLKDASAAAIYGSRGSNGVIIITTKRGKTSQPSVSYNAYGGYASVLKKIKMLDAYQYSQLIYDAHNNSYLDLLADRNIAGTGSDDNATRLSKLGAAAGTTNQGYLIPPEILPYLAGTPGLTNTDWQNEVFRNAGIQNHTLSIGGGSTNVRYYVSGNYFDQNGIVIGTGFKRYGGRVNLDANYKKFKLGTSINYAYERYEFQPNDGRFLSQENIVPIALSAAPFFPVYNPDGSYNYSQYNYQYGTSQTINPVALANQKSDISYMGKLLANMFIQYNFTPEFSNKVTFAANIDAATRDTYRPSTLPTLSPSAPTSIPQGSYRSLSLVNWMVSNTMTYDKRFGDHSLNVVADLSAQKESQSSISVNATGYANDLITTLNGATSVPTFGGGTNQWTLLSGLTRVQYSFKERYQASAAIRADGSSRFGARSKYGYFPSVSAGWNVFREDFMRSVKAISSLKLRASFGVTGNNQVGDYASLSTLGAANYVFGNTGTLSNGLFQNSAGNDLLGWEKTSAFNLGLEFGVFDEMLHLTVDAYTNNTSDMLLNVPVPQSSGFNSNLINLGKVQNRGVEFTLNSQNKIGEFSIATSANMSFNRNKVLDLGGQQSIITQSNGVVNFITQVGQPIGNYYTLVQTGIFKNQSELNAGPTVAGAKVGDMKFADINGDGKIDATSDRAMTGNYTPKFTYGFSTQMRYKSLDLSAALQGLYGNKIANINTRYINSFETFTNNTAEALDRFVSESQPGDGMSPRANRSQRGLNASMSTYSIKDGSYMRIRDLTLGFTFPSTMLKSTGISKLRVYFSATNPFIFTKYNAYNPEVSQDTNPLMPGVDYGGYPLNKTFVLGLNLSL